MMGESPALRHLRAARDELSDEGRKSLDFYAGAVTTLVLLLTRGNITKEVVMFHAQEAMEIALRGQDEHEAVFIINAMDRFVSILLEMGGGE